MRHDHLIDEIEPRGFDRALLRRLLGYLAPYRGRMALAILLLFGAALLQLVGPYLVKVGIDGHIAPGEPRRARPCRPALHRRRAGGLRPALRPDAADLPHRPAAR